MKLFKLDIDTIIKSYENDSVYKNMSVGEKNDCVNKVIFTKILHNYYKYKDNTIKLYVNRYFLVKYIYKNPLFTIDHSSADLIGNIIGLSVYILESLKNDEYFLGKSLIEYEVCLRNKKIKKLIEKIS